MVSVRELVFKFIEASLKSNASTAEEDLFDDAATGELSAEDRGLFQEISRGTLREWLYLDFVVSNFVKRKPSEPVQILIYLSAYQLLFLDRVPAYAIFSELKSIAEKIRLSEVEIKFLHAVLKSVEKNKTEILERRRLALERAKSGELPKKELDYSVLNAAPSLVDALTVVDSGLNKKDARRRAVRALVAMKERSKLWGYSLSGVVAGAEVPLEGAGKNTVKSTVAPRAIILESGRKMFEDLREGRVRIQGEASQWACEIAAKKLLELSGSCKRVLRVAELAAGKGGKLIGTLSALTGICGNSGAVPALEWLAADISSQQLDLLKKDILPLVKKFWPQVTVKVSNEKNIDVGKMDFVWIDAPCTGFGTISKLPQIALKYGESAYDEALKLSEIQRRLFLDGFSMLGGTLFYTVCTLTRPETLDMVEFMSGKIGRSPEFMQSLWPGSPPAPEAEGFFAVII